MFTKKLKIAAAVFVAGILADGMLAPDKNIRDFAEVGPRLLDPGMRAVNVSVPADHAVHTIIRTDEYVDVWLRRTIVDSNGKSVVRFARLDRNCKVVMKRGGPARGEDFIFTLQANPYRAALIEYAREKGSVTLMPVPHNGRIPLGLEWKDANNLEYRDEDERVQKIENGEYKIGEADLDRIFRIARPAGIEKSRQELDLQDAVERLRVAQEKLDIKKHLKAEVSASNETEIELVAEIRQAEAEVKQARAALERARKHK